MNTQKSIKFFTWKTIQNEFNIDKYENPYKLIHKNSNKNLHSHLYSNNNIKKSNNENNIQNFQLDLYRRTQCNTNECIINKNTKINNNIITDDILPQKQNISIKSDNYIINDNTIYKPIQCNCPHKKTIKYHINLDNIPKIDFFYCYNNNVFDHLELNFFNNWNYYGDNNNSHNYLYIHKILSKYIKIHKNHYTLLIDKKDITIFCDIINIPNNILQKNSNIKFMNEYKMLETNIFIKKHKNNILLSLQSANNSLNTKQITISNFEDFSHIVKQLNTIKTNNHFLFNIDILLDYIILNQYE